MKTLLPVLFLFISSMIYAHQDITSSQNDGNLYLEHIMSFPKLEANNKVDIFYRLLDKLIKIKKYKTSCCLYFQYIDANKKPSYTYTLGYGKADFVTRAFEDKDIEGINLTVRTNDFDIKELLNLVNSAFENVELIKKSQKQIFIDLNMTSNGTPQFDTLNSIENNIIETYKQRNDSVVNQLIQEKTHKFLEKDYTGELDYFYQNNQFHFYNNKDKVILSVNNIFEIFGNPNFHFVFINDSMFYYFDRQDQNVSKLFTIKDMPDRGSPVYEFYYDMGLPARHFLIFSYYGNLKKILFLPDEEKVISNYGEYEDELIDSFINKKEEEKQSNDYLIWWWLGISLVVNAWLLLRLKNKK